MIRVLSLAAAIGLSACAAKQPPLQSTADLTVIEMASGLPAPERTDLVAGDRPALVGPLDTIEIDVFRVPELTREVQIDASGRVSLPLIGTIDARGLTANELAAVIERELGSRYLRDPQVTVNIRNSVSQVVAVSGQVVEPGLYPVTNQMTLLRAVASAKGLGEFAKRKDVVILRTVDGRRMAGLYDMTAIERGLYADPAIYANDVIIVGDSPQRRMFKDFVSVAPLLASPIVAILQNVGSKK